MTKKEKTSAASEPSAAELMTLIAERAPALRAAGITSMSIGGFSVTLAPGSSPEPAPPPKPEPVRKHYVNPLEDPDTFPGGRVPGYSRDEEPRR